jgi:predicted nucleic-acid-binding protein
MIGVDTNILLRYVLLDDPHQGAAARRLIDDECAPERPAIVHPIVLCEMWWTLKRHWKVKRGELIETLSALLANPNLAFHDLSVVTAATRAYARGPADFPDYLILFDNRRFGAVDTLTFDRTASGPALMTRLS